jgi:RND family efflux transporter MFP subunit
MKRLRAVLVFIIVLAVGFVIVTSLLPALLKGPKVTRLPPGVKPEGASVPEESLPVPVRTFKAAKIEFTDLLPTLGTVRGQTEVELKFEVSGTLQAINFREGDLAKEGQELAAVDDREAQLRVGYAESKQATAEAQLKLARKRLSVNEELFRIGAIIRPKLEESQIEVEQAETQVETAVKEAGLAEHELGRTTLEAPMDGVVGTRQVEPGEYVTPQNVIATLMDVNAVYVELGIIERDIERIRLGQRVKVSVDSLPNTTFEGKVDNLAPLIEGKSRTLTAKVKVENTQGQLLPGMFARAEIAVFEKPNALVIPTSALKDTDGDGKFESVFVAAAGDKAALKPITVGYLTTDYAEVSQGLDEGDQVITEARGNLKEGSALTFLEQEEAAFERAEPEVKGPEPER